MDKRAHSLLSGWADVMGFERVEFVVAANLSRHNSDRDDRHDKLWDEVTKRIEEIINDPKYIEINLMSGF
jgi:hypothetical protein